jgi:tetratricopeptide (TPR) repeat protein/tRNA A-37 threonylcarbamoyl transferase component Bud32
MMAQSANRPPTPEGGEPQTLVLGPELRPFAGDESTAVHALGGDAQDQLATLVSRRSKANGFPTVPGYELLEELGRGGNGIVFKARHRELDRLVALKMLRLADIGDVESVSRFRSEAEAVARLQHPNIVQIHEVMESAGGPLFALEYLDGGDLSRKLAGRPQPAQPAARLLELVARAVDHAHQQGIVHRDLKPANVLLGADGTPKITDFGIAKQLMADSHLTRTGEIIGTPSYMAPEQAAGQTRTLSATVDVYSLGAILYEMLTGRAPFLAPTAVDTLLLVRFEEPVSPRRLQPSVPVEVETICLKCLHKDPARRYASALELADDLRHFQRGEPIRARPPSGLTRLREWARRRPARAALIVGTVLAFVGLLGASGWYNSVLLEEIADADAGREQAVVAQAHAERRGQDVDRQCQELTKALAAAKLVRRQADQRRQEVEQALAAARLAQENDGAARLDAEQHTAEARKAMDSMLTRLAEAYLRHVPAMDKVRRALLEDALAYYQGLAMVKGTDAKTRQAAADAAWRVGKIQQELGHFGPAEKAYRDALHLHKKLHEDFPDELRYRADLASCYFDLCLLQGLYGRLQEAEGSCREALKLWRGLADEDSDNEGYASRVAETLHRLALQLRFTGRLKDAEEALRDGKQHYEALLEGGTPDVQYQARYAWLLADLAALLDYTQRPKEAEPLARKAFDLQDRLFRDYPEEITHQHKLAVTCCILGLTLDNLHRYRDAEKVLRLGVDLLEKLTTDYPSLPDYRSDLARCVNNLGIALLGLGQRDDGERAYRKVIEIRRQLVKEFPKVPDYLSDLGGTLNNLAISCRVRGDHAEARKLLLEAIDFQLAALKANPRHPTYKYFLRNHYANITRVFLDLKDHAEAARAAALICDLYPDKADDLYLSAAFTAKCCTLASTDEKLTADQRTDHLKRYGEAAVDHLRRALRCGLRDPRRLTTDPAFESLRQREDFQKLLRDFDL